MKFHAAAILLAFLSAECILASPVPNPQTPENDTIMKRIRGIAESVHRHHRWGIVTHGAGKKKCPFHHHSRAIEKLEDRRENVENFSHHVSRDVEGGDIGEICFSFV